MKDALTAAAASLLAHLALEGDGAAGLPRPEAEAALADALVHSLPSQVQAVRLRLLNPPKEAGIQCCPTCHRWRVLVAEPVCRTCAGWGA